MDEPDVWRYKGKGNFDIFRNVYRFVLNRSVIKYKEKKTQALWRFFSSLETYYRGRVVKLISYIPLNEIVWTEDPLGDNYQKFKLSLD